MTALRLDNVSVTYNNHQVIERLNWHAEEGKIYSIIGPNGCGKSTLLKAIAGQLKPVVGSILLNGRSISSFTRRELARQLSMLQQSQDKLPDMTVRTLVGYGRFPHKPAWTAMSQEDEDIVDWALLQTGTLPFAQRKLSALSGGERQRVWIALALAQKPRLLLLDEPTTYLDVSHQWEIMELISEINQKFGMTIIMVLHDMNHAAGYSDEIMVMNKGEVYASGKPEDTITEQTLGEVFGVNGRIERDPDNARLTCLVTGLLPAERR
ncbi:iron ABC transporter ATP-binding protein [Paenibacillus rhizosphaerae]|uniref:Iron ABC transporter ATP-binding protein n=1 Tax=Paenibacillus rhizosphaerae TaxID=297318 RepID=A0A1R1EC62_9BACL|nr:ABC transporter ATP-binding protein [Paenibacillus rhizosphaerae]OMF49406.1 iron ABC transporter ATP-binding protein [Paenibacillus rhizosphaerae]